MACFSLEEFETAKRSFEKGLELDSSNAIWKTWIRKCDAELEQQPQKREVLSNQQSNQTQTSEPGQSPPSRSTPSSNEQNQQLTPTDTTTSPQQQQQQQQQQQSQQSSTTIPKIRHEWYQNNSHVIVTIFAKSVKKENLEVNIHNKSVSLLLIS